ncbi:MAG: DUF1559 domain-containing protein, partial [Planctomycetales bacterium]|nr:DUF1559 domain-containing protein [Planctomycetales bacterium]
MKRFNCLRPRRRLARRHRRGFARVDLCVVATIFLLAFALAAPATQLSRESARRATCTDHLRQIGLALNQY